MIFDENDFKYLHGKDLERVLKMVFLSVVGNWLGRSLALPSHLWQGEAPAEPGL